MIKIQYLLGQRIRLKNALRRVVSSLQLVELLGGFGVVSCSLTSDGKSNGVSSTRKGADSSFECNICPHLISCFIFYRIRRQFFRDGQDLLLRELMHSLLRVETKLGTDLLRVVDSESVELGSEADLQCQYSSG